MTQQQQRQQKPSNALPFIAFYPLHLYLYLYFYIHKTNIVYYHIICSMLIVDSPLPRKKKKR